MGSLGTSSQRPLKASGVARATKIGGVAGTGAGLKPGIKNLKLGKNCSLKNLAIGILGILKDGSMEAIVFLIVSKTERGLAVGIIGAVGVVVVVVETP